MAKIAENPSKPQMKVIEINKNEIQDISEMTIDVINKEVAAKESSRQRKGATQTNFKTIANTGSQIEIKRADADSMVMIENDE